MERGDHLEMFTWRPILLGKQLRICMTSKLFLGYRETGDDYDYSRLVRENPEVTKSNLLLVAPCSLAITVLSTTMMIPPLL
jgi:hypothetical protein